LRIFSRRKVAIQEKYKHTSDRIGNEIEGIKNRTKYEFGKDIALERELLDEMKVLECLYAVCEYEDE
jgi:hypothetical protein